MKKIKTEKLCENLLSGNITEDDKKEIAQRLVFLKELSGYCGVTDALGYDDARCNVCIFDGECGKVFDRAEKKNDHKIFSDYTEKCKNKLKSKMDKIT